MTKTRNLKTLFLVWFFAGFVHLGDTSGHAQTDSQSSPIPRAHAHNDYYHKRPLLDALDHGFCSVEADVFLHKGKLLVAHTFIEIKKQNTLQNLYLDPLLKRFNSKGYIVKSKRPFTLLVDFKNDGEATLEVLNEQLAGYKKILTRVVDNKVIEGAVTVIISGARPIKKVAGQKSRFVFLDGRLGDPDSIDSTIAPLVSESWNSHFKYRGFGEMPDAERKKLRKIVDEVHGQGKRIRFWALPDRENAWQVAFDEKVDLINTDKLSELRKFLLDANQKIKQ